MPADANVERWTLGSSLRAGVMGAVLLCLPAHFLMFIDDGVPAVAGPGVLVLAGTTVAASTVVTGLALVIWKRTRRFGLGLLLGSAATSVLSAALLFGVLLFLANTVGS